MSCLIYKTYQIEPPVSESDRFACIRTYYQKLLKKLIIKKILRIYFLILNLLKFI